MDALTKMRLMGQETKVELAEEVSLTGERSAPITEAELPGCIHHACTPNGTIALLKGMVSSACEKNCFYCGIRAGRDFHRVSFQPDELAALLDRLYKAKVVEGFFLSSAVCGSAIRTQDQIIATAEILRERYQFRGYLHLKIMPGAETEQIHRTMALADRVSVNLEAPNSERLAALAPRKTFLDELVQPLRVVEKVRQEVGGFPGSWENWRRSGPSLTTQFVVGPAGESDVELLKTTSYLYHTLKLARTYFSGFHPIEDTPLEDNPPTDPTRERRLYQASFLLRDYGFRVDDLAFDESARLPLDVDPKLAWAQRYLGDAPVELNTAARRELLRVPGIGPRLADKLIEARQENKLRELADLRKLGVPPDRVAPFILLNGRRPAYQLRLF